MLATIAFDFKIWWWFRYMSHYELLFYTAGYSALFLFNSLWNIINFPHVEKRTQYYWISYWNIYTIKCFWYYSFFLLVIWKNANLTIYLYISRLSQIVCNYSFEKKMKSIFILVKSKYFFQKAFNETISPLCWTNKMVYQGDIIKGKYMFRYILLFLYIPHAINTKYSSYYIFSKILISLISITFLLNKVKY